MPTAVTDDQILQIQTDFNTLLDDVLTAVPHDSRVDMAVMMFKMAETAVITLLKQHKAHP